MTLKIAQGFSLPPDTVTQTLGIVAQRGAGKTYLTAVLSEEMIGARLPVVIVDPMGVYWGLRLAADGKAPGLDVVILGGERGDVPLEPTAGKVIADWIATEHRACVLDLSGFRKGEQRQFVTDFAEELYRKNRDPLHLILDEADMWAPQRPQPGEQRMLGAVEDLVRRGRARGIGLSLVTQRPAVINKDVLTQVSALVALRIVGPQDRKAVEEWTKYHDASDEREAVLSSLGSLPIGTAWFWSPGWLGKLEKVAVRARRTFDSSSTPKVGEKRAAPRELAPVDLDALRGKIADTIARAKADDPKALKARIADLEKQAAKVEAPAAAPAPRPVVERVEVQVPVLVDVAMPQLDEGALLNPFESYAQQADAIHGLATALKAEVTRGVKVVKAELAAFYASFERAKREARSYAKLQAREASKQAKVGTASPKREPERQSVHAVAPTLIRQNGTSPNLASVDASISRCARQILTALAQHGDLSLVQAAIISGYAPDSGSVRNAAGDLRAHGLAEGSNAKLSITESGSSEVSDAPILPTGKELAVYWYGKLERAERLILGEIVAVYPKSISLKDAATRAGYEPSSGSVRNAAGKLRTLTLVHGGNASMAADRRLVD